jgi:hypothetical protein
LHVRCGAYHFPFIQNPTLSVAGVRGEATILVSCGRLLCGHFVACKIFAENSGFVNDGPVIFAGLANYACLVSHLSLVTLPRYLFWLLIPDLLLAFILKLTTSPFVCLGLTWPTEFFLLSRASLAEVHATQVMPNHIFVPILSEVDALDASSDTNAQT